MTNEILAYTQQTVNAWPEIQGVIVAEGAGISITVKDGHLVVKDGLGASRRERKYSKVTRDISRLLIFSRSGYLTLDAIAWLKLRNIQWCQLSQEEGILATSGPLATTDARLLRAQAYAPASEAGLEITQYILGQKLRSSAEILAGLLCAPEKAAYVANRAGVIETVDSIALALVYEGLAASNYWDVWRKFPVTVPFKKADSELVPSHWLKFSDRYSLSSNLTRNRLATDPINAMLNYLIAGIALTECVHACHTVGLSPNLGIFHSDKPGRDGLALDILECVRPVCEKIVLEILTTGEAIDRKWFHEEHDGTVRLVSPLTHKLAGYSTIIADALTVHTYHIATILAKYGDGIIPVAKPKNIGSAIGRATERLRKGVTTKDVITDDCWEQIRVILPERQAGIRVSACPERDIIAALAVKYLLNCPWSQTIIQPAYRRVAGRQFMRWQKTGTWEQIKSILEKSNHLAPLLST